MCSLNLFLRSVDDAELRQVKHSLASLASIQSQAHQCSIKPQVCNSNVIIV